MSGPIDRRLLREAAPARRALLLAVGLGLASTGLIVAQAVVLADVLAGALAGSPATAGSLALLAGLLAARAGTAWLSGTASSRCSAQVKSELRMRLVERSLAAGPTFLTRHRTGEVAVLATRGIDALDPWFARFLPQLVLSAAVPLAVIATLATVDLLSAAVVALTVPLIPVFMVLVGLHTRSRTERSWATLQALGGHFLDTVRGMPTLRIFGRGAAQARAVAEVTEQHRQATMQTLRVAFMSALVLELLSTLSVAVVAVEIGLRLIHGHITYEPALLVLLLAPEAYLPLRRVGGEYHASQEGAAASRQVFALLDDLQNNAAPAPERPAGRTNDRCAGLIAHQLKLSLPGRLRPVLDDVTLHVRPGERVAVTGPSGSGKSTLLSVLAGLRPAQAGVVQHDNLPLTAADAGRWRAQVAWLGQTARLSGPVADLVRLGDPGADDTAVRRALTRVGLDTEADAVIHEDGSGLSVGQKRRMCLARALLRVEAGARILLLDEPTEGLDPHSAAVVRDVLAELPADVAVVAVTHDAGLARSFDRVLELRDGSLHERSTSRALVGAT